MDKTLYVVSGFMRTGTTMMMKALEAGGMHATYNNELYELSPTRFHPYDFPREYEGRLVKIMGGALLSSAVMPYGMKVIFMMRNPREIEDSYEKMFGQKAIFNNYERDMQYILDRLHNRKDVMSVHKFDYKDVVCKPRYQFSILRTEGWDFNLDKAYKVVDPSLYRSNCQ